MADHINTRKIHVKIAQVTKDRQITKLHGLYTINEALSLSEEKFKDFCFRNRLSRHSKASRQRLVAA